MTATPADVPRAMRLRPTDVALVVAGGAVGTGAREALTLVFPPVNGVPLTVLGINVAGAFLLGLLLGSLAHHGAGGRGRRHTLQLLLGTGALGGFTTYSALSADAAHLIGSGAAGLGVAYGLASVLLGAIATVGGMAAGVARHRRQGSDA